MTGTYQSVGYPCTAGLGVLKPAVLLEICVKLLQVVLRELTERYRADGWDDVLIDTVFVSGSCGFPQCRLAEVLIPEVKPIAEGHVRLESLGNLAEFFFQCF